MTRVHVSIDSPLGDVNTSDERPSFMAALTGAGRYDEQVQIAQLVEKVTTSALNSFGPMDKPDGEPWKNAKPGDIWLLTYGGQPTAHVFTERWEGGPEYAFVSDRAIVTVDDEDITEGRRIWPSATI